MRKQTVWVWECLWCDILAMWGIHTQNTVYNGMFLLDESRNAQCHYIQRCNLALFCRWMVTGLMLFGLNHWSDFHVKFVMTAFGFNLQCQIDGVSLRLFNYHTCDRSKMKLKTWVVYVFVRGKSGNIDKKSLQGNEVIFIGEWKSLELRKVFCKKFLFLLLFIQVSHFNIVSLQKLLVLWKIKILIV